MKHRRISFVFALSCLCATSAGAANHLPAGNPFRAGYANLPVSFEANIGQEDPAVKFLAHGQGGDLLLTGSEAWLTLQNSGGENEPHSLRLKLAGANPNPRLEGLDPLPGKANYLIGNDSSRWLTDVPTFARVRYHDVYPGVDLIYYGNQQKLEYDLVVQPGADPNNITLEFTGADKISLDADGDLLLCLGAKTVRQHKPIVYQENAGTRKMLSGNYVLHSGMQVGFEIADYDQTQPLVIDPVLAFSATFGGSGLNQGLGVALDTNDNVYVTGVTTSGDFPTMNPFQTNKLGSHSAFIVKFNTNGAVVYSTFLGGGVLNDQTITSSYGQGIAVDANGDAFVTGYTTATNFPVKNALQPTNGGTCDAFVAELNPAGNGLIFSTYLGGKGFDAANGITLDTNTDAIITGFTLSTNFPTFNAAQPVYGGNGDAFVAKLNAAGSALIYSTYLGGNDSENNLAAELDNLPASVQANFGGAVAVDFDGNAFVTGSTFSTNFPILNAYQPTNNAYAASYVGGNLYRSAFLTEFSPAGSLVFSTYFGDSGSGSTVGRAIGVDFNDNVYIAGSSQYGLPTTNAFQPYFTGSGAANIGDSFIAAFDSSGTNLLYSTYLGGSGDDQVNGIAVRPGDGAVAVTGFTDSPNFPVMNAIQPVGDQGLFMSANGAASWNLSKAGLDSGVIYSIQVDPSNHMTVYALTANGCFKSTDGGADWASASTGLGSVFPSSYGSPSSLLAMDPLHPGTLYVGGYAGVYKTTNGAASWTLASAGIPSFSDVHTIAVDPAMPTTLYAGTYFNGIYKSTNGAVTWNTMSSGLNNLDIDEVVVDPNNSSNVYAGVENLFAASLFKSTNGGGNWTLLGGGLQGGPVNLLVASASTPTTIYSVIGNSFNNAPTLAVSTNGGLNWSALLSAGGLSFTALAIAPSSVPALTIASSGANDIVSWPASFAGYVLQSTASLNPANWKNVMLSLATNNGSVVMTVPVSGPQGFYRLISTNNSSSPPTLYLGTDQASGQGVLKSTDGGINWNATGPAGDTINALAVNPAYLATVYAGLNGGRDGFVTALRHNGQLYSSTYIGGSGSDQDNAIALDFTDVYLTGTSGSGDFPTTSVRNSVFRANKVEPSNGNRIPAISTSLTPTYQQVVFSADIRELLGCPDDAHFGPVTIRNGQNAGGEKVGQIGYGEIVLNNVIGAPPGLSLSVGDTFALPDDVSGPPIQAFGTPTTPGTYTAVLNFTQTRNNIPCSWNVYIEIIVK